jgi:hypothetical protein
VTRCFYTKLGTLNLAPSIEHDLGSAEILFSGTSQEMGRLRWEKTEDGKEMSLYWSMPPILGIDPHGGFQIFYRIAKNSAVWDATIYIHILPAPIGAENPVLEQYWFIQCDGGSETVTTTQLGVDTVIIPQYVAILDINATDTTIYGFREDIGNQYRGIANDEGVGFSWEGGGFEFYTEDFDLIATGTAGGEFAYRLAYLKAQDSSKKIGIDLTPNLEKVWIDDGNGILDGEELAVDPLELLVGDDAPGIAFEASSDGPFLFSSGDNTFILGTISDPATCLLPLGFECSYSSALLSMQEALSDMVVPGEPDYAAIAGEINDQEGSLSGLFPLLD